MGRNILGFHLNQNKNTDLSNSKGGSPTNNEIMNKKNRIKAMMQQKIPLQAKLRKTKKKVFASRRKIKANRAQPKSNTQLRKDSSDSSSSSSTSSSGDKSSTSNSKSSSDSNSSLSFDNSLSRGYYSDSYIYKAYYKKVVESERCFLKKNKKILIFYFEY